MGDTMREAFEAWLRTGEDFCPALLSSYTAGDGCITYVDSNIDWQWKAFMAGHFAGRQLGMEQARREIESLRRPMTDFELSDLYRKWAGATGVSFADLMRSVEQHCGIPTPPAGDSDTKEN